MGLDLLFGLGFLATATFSGSWVIRRFITEGALTPLEQNFAGFCIGGFGISLTVWMIGSLAYTPLTMWMLAILWAGCGLACFRPWFDAQRAVEGSKYAWAAFLVFLILTFISGLAPPADYDGLNYHLLLPRRDLEFGRIVVIPNDRVFEAFPSLAEMLYRLALATSGASAAQILHGLFGIASGFGTIALVRRLGGNANAAVIAGSLFLAIRIIFWQAGTTHNELALAAYFVLALIAYLAWREYGGMNLAILAGLAVSGACNVKYHGLVLALAFLPVMAHDIFKQKGCFKELGIGVSVAIFAFLPHLVRNWLNFGNPLAPFFGRFFPSSAPVSQMDFLPRETAFFESLVGLLRSPWDIFIYGNQNFDGHTFGAPFLLILIPFIVICWKTLAHRWSVLGILIIYYVIWYFMMFNTTRFLIPVFPILAALAGIGAVAFWEVIKVFGVARWATVILFIGLGLNQLMFIGAHSALRGAVTFGLIEESKYLLNAPGQSTTYFAACRKVETLLKPGEFYISIMTMRSYYCPQRPVIYDVFGEERKLLSQSRHALPVMGSSELADRILKTPVALILIATNIKYASRGRAKWTDVPLSFSSHRLWKALEPGISNLAPIFETKNARIYSGPEVAARLKALSINK